MSAGQYCIIVIITPDALQVAPHLDPLLTPLLTWLSTTLRRTSGPQWVISPRPVPSTALVWSPETRWTSASENSTYLIQYCYIVIWFWDLSLYWFWIYNGQNPVSNLSTTISYTNHFYTHRKRFLYYTAAVSLCLYFVFCYSVYWIRCFAVLYLNNNKSALLWGEAQLCLSLIREKKRKGSAKCSVWW